MTCETKPRTDRARHGYGRAWNRRSQAWLHTTNMHCALRYPDICTSVATEVDHIKGWKNQREFWDKRNWQPVCKRCHSRKTAREMRAGPAQHDASGLPTDPDHPFYDEEE